MLLLGLLLGLRMVGVLAVELLLRRVRLAEEGAHVLRHGLAALARCWLGRCGLKSFAPREHAGVTVLGCVNFAVPAVLRAACPPHPQR